MKKDMPELAKFGLVVAVLLTTILVPFNVGYSAMELREIPHSEPVRFSEVSDVKAVSIRTEVQKPTITQPQEKEAPEAQETGDQPYNLPVWEGDMDPYAEYAIPQSGYSYGGVSGDPNGLNSFVGVVEWNGTRETAYSSNVLYHYRTSEWTPDEYGFYRTEDGYYVVGSDDYEQGTVIETSRGPAIVSDCGGDPGIVDFYVNW